MQIIKDLRTLKAIARKYNFKIDKKYKYITDTNNLDFKMLKYYNNNFKIIYFDGCFNPFLCKIN